MQTVQPKLLQHSGYSHNCANQWLPVSALCLQSRPLCFEKYRSLVPSAFCSDIRQAKRATTILWTPNPSTDQAGTAATAVFSTNILARAFSRGTQANHSSKSQARSNHSWNQQAEAAGGVNSHGFLWQNAVICETSLTWIQKICLHR